PGSTTAVMFVDRAGHRFYETPTAVTSTSVQVAAPLYLQANHVLATTGWERVSVVQIVGGKMTTTKAIGHLQITAPAATGKSAGTIANQALAQLASDLKTALYNYQSLQGTFSSNYSYGAFPTDLVNQIQTAQAEVAGLQQLVGRFTSGKVTQVGLGTYRGLNNTMNQASLTLLDQLLAGTAQGAKAGTGVLNSSGSLLSSLIGGALNNVEMLTKNFTKIGGAKVVGASNVTSVVNMAASIASLESFASYQTYVSGQLVKSVTTPSTALDDKRGIAEATTQFVMSAPLIQQNIALVGPLQATPDAQILKNTVAQTSASTTMAPGFNSQVADQAMVVDSLIGLAKLQTSTTASPLSYSGIIPEDPAATGPPVARLSTKVVFLTVMQGSSNNYYNGNFSITNSGGGSLNVSVTGPTKLGLTGSQNSDNSSVNIYLNPDTSSLPVGTYSYAPITVTSTNGTSSSQTVQVYVNVIGAPTNSPQALPKAIDYSSGSSSNSPNTSFQYNSGSAYQLQSSYSGTYQDLITLNAGTAEATNTYYNGTIKLQVSTVVTDTTGSHVLGTLTLTNFAGKTISRSYVGTYSGQSLTITSNLDLSLGDIDPNTGLPIKNATFSLTFQLGTIGTQPGSLPALSGYQMSISDGQGNNDYNNGFATFNSSTNYNSPVYAFLTKD
ncbi:hypothetical protein ACYOEI_09120, partial [Singulisphaera rosea]